MKDLLFARVLRKIAIKFPKFFLCYYYPQSNQKDSTYLTFDDGPHPKITPKILGILNEKAIKATFFVGGQALTYPEICKDIISEGHSLGGHTLTHQYLPKLNNNIFIKETVEYNMKLSDIFGLEINLFRPPYGFITPRQIFFLRGKGLKIVLWTLDTLDCFSGQPIEQKVALCGEKAKNSDIILMHDTIQKNIEYSDKLIDYLLKKNFVMKNIT